MEYYRNWELIIRGEVFDKAYIVCYSNGFGIYRKYESKYYKTYKGAYNYLVKNGFTPKEVNE